MTEEEILAAEEERKSNLVGHEEFKILTSRVDVMDQSIGKIVGRVSFHILFTWYIIFSCN